jgi:hypothetical protein
MLTMLTMVTGVQGVFSGTIALTADTFYEVRMDYRHKTGSASAQVRQPQPDNPQPCILNSEFHPAWYSY